MPRDGVPSGGGPRGAGGPAPLRPPPDLCGRHGKDGAHGVVELPQAGKAGREGDVVEGHLGGLDQQAGGLGALGPRQIERSSAELIEQHSPQVARAVSEPPGEAFDAFAVDDAVGDQAHGAPGGVGAQVPLRRAGHRVGAAAQAGAKAGALGGRRRGEEAHVFALRRARGAARPAVDAGRRDAHEEPAVEARVVALHGAVAGVGIGQHDGDCTRRAEGRLAGIGRPERDGAYAAETRQSKPPRGGTITVSQEPTRRAQAPAAHDVDHKGKAHYDDLH